MRYRLAVLLLAAGLPFAAARGQDIDYLIQIEPRHYLCRRALGPIEVDGHLDEPSWQRAVWSEFFVDIEGRRQPAPRFETRVKMLWDDTYLYVAADLEEPQVWATLRARDATIYHDDDFEVFIDPDGDTHEYYEFEINAYGTEWDLFLSRPYRDGGRFMNAWRLEGLQSAVQVWGTLNDARDIDRGWSVEIAFPWEVLEEHAAGRRPPQAGEQWRVNFSRVEWEVGVDRDSTYVKEEGRSEDNWVWSPQGLVNMHYPEQWGFVQFSKLPVGRGEAEFVPAPEEEAKKVLREIYYRQRQFREEHGHYTAALDSLGVEYRIVRDFMWPPQIQVTEHLFEAAMEEVVDLNDDGRISRWIIREDSRTWKE